MSSFDFTALVFKMIVLFIMTVLFCFVLAAFLSLTCGGYTERLYVMLIKHGVLLPDEPIDSDWVVIERMGDKQLDMDEIEEVLGETVSGGRRRNGVKMGR